MRMGKAWSGAGRWRGEMGVVEGQGDDEVGVVGLGKCKEDTTVWGEFLGS